MTKNTSILYLVPLFFCLLWACGKNKGDAPPPGGQYGQFFSNTLWGGSFKYTTRAYPEPMGIAFSENGTFVWRDMDGDAPGTYTIDNVTGRLNMAFTQSGGKMSANVLADGLLSDFTYGQAGWEIKSLKLSTISSTNMTGTVWLGDNGPSTFEQLTFQPNGVVLHSNLNESSYYNQGAQVIRFSNFLDGPVKVRYKYLLVQVSDSTMLGLEMRDFVGRNLTNFYTATVKKQ